MELLKFCRASSFVVKPTLCTPSIFSMAFMTVSMSDCSASSDTYAVMETLSSTDFTVLSTIRPPTRKMPMMSRDRKIVIIEPSVVERFRVKPVSDSLKK